MGYKGNNLPPLTDKDPMPSGKYKDTPMEEVPAKHLMWIYDNGLCGSRVKQYIEENKDVIIKQAKEEGYGVRNDD